MRRKRTYRSGIAAAMATTSLWAVAAVIADDPKPAEDPSVQQVVQQPPPTVPPPVSPGTQPPPTIPPPTGTQPGDTGSNQLAPQIGLPSAAPGLPPAANLGADLSSARKPIASPPRAPRSRSPAGKRRPCSTLPTSASCSPSRCRRPVSRFSDVTSLSSDPRIRGYRVGQIVTMGDGAFFFPARQDLDTAIAKFDPGSVRDIVIIKGPYTTVRGPGFSFLDIATVDSPRYANGFEAHGRTSFGYQQNGDRWDGLQSVFGGGSDWGFRVTTNLLAGSDYRDGNNMPIASSYNSTNVNYALGADLTDYLHLEFKGLNVSQHDLEFPGLYFDVDKLYTEAYQLALHARSPVLV